MVIKANCNTCQCLCTNLEVQYYLFTVSTAGADYDRKNAIHSLQYQALSILNF